jgi:hypothetical protein
MAEGAVRDQAPRGPDGRRDEERTGEDPLQRADRNMIEML